MNAQLGLFDDQPLVGEFPLPEGARLGRCKSCDCEVAWIQTKDEKWMPLDLSTARDINGVRYAMTHFATCEHAKEWSRKK